MEKKKRWRQKFFKGGEGEVGKKWFVCESLSHKEEWGEGEGGRERQKGHVRSLSPPKEKK